MESSLSAHYNELVGGVGNYFGWGRGAANGDIPWTDDKIARINDCVRSGLRNFYFNGYTWSFLKPVFNVATTQDSQTIDLPDDFGSLDSRILWVDPSRTTYEVPISGNTRVLYSTYPNATGFPEMAEVEPVKGTSPTEGQRFRLRVWPLPDAVYTLQLRYNILPDFLSGSKPYVYGGAEHSETVLESCLAVAESRYDDISPASPAAVHAPLFRQLLANSISMDRRKKPQLIGYNGDQSEKYDTGMTRIRTWPSVTINGVVPDTI